MSSRREKDFKVVIRLSNDGCSSVVKRWRSARATATIFMLSSILQCGVAQVARGGRVERCIVIELNQLKWLPHYTTYLTVSETHMCKI